MSPANAEALWGLRCSIGHVYGLSKAHPSPGGPHFRFALHEKGPIIRKANVPWDGTALPVPYDNLTARRRHATAVNVHAVGDYVERLVANVRTHHARGAVELSSNVTASQVLAFRQYF